MKTANLKSLCRYAHQLGQGMVEYIIILAVVAISSIFVYTQFGDVLRNQTAAGAKALAGEGGDTSAAQNIASAMGGFGGWMRNFGSPGSGGGGSGSSDGGDEGTGGSDTGGSDSGSPGGGDSDDGGSGDGDLGGSSDGTPTAGGTPEGEEDDMTAAAGSNTGIGSDVIDKNRGPVQIVTNNEEGIITTKTVQIVDGKILIDGAQPKVTCLPGACDTPQVDAAVNLGLTRGHDPLYGKGDDDDNPLDDPLVLALIAYSPGLQAGLKTLIQERGWNVRYAPSDKASSVDYGRKIIFIQRGNPVGTLAEKQLVLNEVGVVQHLAHEVGHALWNPSDYTVNNLPAGMKQKIEDAREAYMNAPNGSQAERDAMAAYLKAVEDGYLQVQLENEGAGVLKNIDIQREIEANKGGNIGVNCGAGACNTLYDPIYEEYRGHRNADTARKAIAVLRKDENTGSGPTYEVYYRDQFRNAVSNRPGSNNTTRQQRVEEALRGAKYEGTVTGRVVENRDAPWLPLRTGGGRGRP